MKTQFPKYLFVSLFFGVMFQLSFFLESPLMAATLTGSKTKMPFLTENTKVVLLDDAIPDFYSDGLLKVKNGNTQKFGYLDVTGKKIFDSEWTCSSTNDARFDGGAAMAVKEMKNYILHRDGTATLLPSKYARPSDFCDGLAFAIKVMGARLKNKLVYINIQGQEVLPGLSQTIEKVFVTLPDKPRRLSEGLRAHLDINKVRWGFVDKAGKPVVAAEFTKVDDFSDGLAAVQVFDANGGGGGKWGFIDKTGKMVVEAKFSEHPFSFSNGFALVKKKEGGFVFIDKSGSAVSPEYPSANSFFGGYAFVITKEGQARGTKYASVIDPTFKEVSRTDYMDIPYDDINLGFQFNSDSIALAHDSGGGCWPVRCDGQVLFRGIYSDYIGDFHDGLALVRVWLKTPESTRYVGFINKKGEMVFYFKNEEF